MHGCALMLWRIFVEILCLKSIVKGFSVGTAWFCYSVKIPFMLWSLRCLFVWLQQVLYDEMPTKFFFDLLRETDEEFVNRTGWYYRHDQLLYVPSSSVLVQPPHLPEGSRPYNPAASNVYPAPFQGPHEPWVYQRSSTWVQWTVVPQHLQLWTHKIGLKNSKTL